MASSAMGVDYFHTYLEGIKRKNAKNAKLLNGFSIIRFFADFAPLR
jgi:hypothetical protein